jgi:glucose-1-phosphate cytidylyltransferase
MQTVILCGGKGLRALPHTTELPKPLLPVDGQPVLAHLLAIYAAQGHTQFILAAGHLAGAVVDFARACPAGWDVEVVDTGRDTGTAARVSAVRHLLDGTFMLNYADGLGDVDLAALRAFHDGHPGAATLTSVPLPSPYGTIDTDGDDRVVDFREKPRLPDHRINGGYFVLDPRALDHFDAPDLERDVLPSLGRAGELYAYRHPGFWMSMDTYKDAEELTELARRGAPWTSV